MTEIHKAPIADWTLVVWAPGTNPQSGTVALYDFNTQEAANAAAGWLEGFGCQCLVVKDPSQA